MPCSLTCKMSLLFCFALRLSSFILVVHHRRQRKQKNEEGREKKGERGERERERKRMREENVGLADARFRTYSFTMGSALTNAGLLVCLRVQSCVFNGSLCRETRLRPSFSARVFPVKAEGKTCQSSRLTLIFF